MPPPQWRFLNAKAHQGSSASVPLLTCLTIAVLAAFTLAFVNPGLCGVPRTTGLLVWYLFSFKTSRMSQLLCNPVALTPKGRAALSAIASATKSLLFQEELRHSMPDFGTGKLRHGALLAVRHSHIGSGENCKCLDMKLDCSKC